MPIHSCTLPDGGSGYRWGDQGKCYPNRADAEKQAQAAYANGYQGDKVAAASDAMHIALDRASVRRYDQDGHLFIETANLSAACVSPYNATEIPDWKSLGLDAGRVYQLLRDPTALEESAASFCGKPLLMMHRAISADDHPHKIVVGAIGSDVRFEKPFLKGSLSVWDADAIRVIESGEQKALSMGYYYQAVMEPGVYEGVPYNGKMLRIHGNHGAIVIEGRVPGAVVGDSALPLITVSETPVQPVTPELLPAVSTEVTQSTDTKGTQIMATRHASLSKQALIASGALRAYLRPKLAADAKLDLTPILQSITAANWKVERAKIKPALDTALVGKLAADAEISDVIDILEELDDVVDDDDEEMGEDETEEDDDEEEKKKKAKEAAEKLKEAAADEKDDDDEEEKKPKAEDESDDDEEDDDKDKRASDRKGARDRKGASDRKPARDKVRGMDRQPMITKQAMDAAIASAVSLATKRAAQEAETSTIARLRAIADAEKAVRPYIGEIAIAQDTAAAVYRLALDAAGVDLTGVPDVAFPAMVKLLPKPQDETKQSTARSARVALDSAGVSRRNEMFPNANRLVVN